MAATATPLQQTQQFLSTVLSQGGPNSLSYEEDTKWLIRQQVMSLVEAFPSLSLSVSTFTHNDGRSLPLLQAHGTIPMAFQGLTYNIPISIWLLESYPRLPPLVYLNPTPDMTIKLPHPNVSPSGLVSHPYLQNWIYPTSNLLHLSRHLSSSFSREPPLYSHRPPPDHTSSYPGPWPPSPYSHSGGLSRVVEEDPAHVFRRNAIGKLAEAVCIDLADIRCNNLNFSSSTVAPDVVPPTELEIQTLHAPTCAAQ